MGAHELTLADCEAWMLGLDYEINGKPDWLGMLKDAGVEANAENLHNFRSRWRKNGGKRNRAKVRAFFEAEERKRRTPTRFGVVMSALDDWQRLGDELAQRPALFLAVKGHVDRMLADLRAIAPTSPEARARAEATARIEAIEAGLNPFEPPPDEPPESPKRPPTSRRDFTPDRSSKR